MLTPRLCPHPVAARFDPDNYGDTSRIIGMPASDDIYDANVPVGGSGAHGRGARSRAPGAAIGPLVSSLLTPGGAGNKSEVNVQMSQI